MKNHLKTIALVAIALSPLVLAPKAQAQTAIPTAILVFHKDNPATPDTPATQPTDTVQLKVTYVFFAGTHMGAWQVTEESSNPVTFMGSGTVFSSGTHIFTCSQTKKHAKGTYKYVGFAGIGLKQTNEDGEYPGGPLQYIIHNHPMP
jgi:hypothetical protein